MNITLAILEKTGELIAGLKENYLDKTLSRLKYLWWRMKKKLKGKRS